MQVFVVGAENGVGMVRGKVQKQDVIPESGRLELMSPVPFVVPHHLLSLLEILLEISHVLSFPLVSTQHKHIIIIIIIN